MQLVEKHVISKSDPRYAAIDKAAFASKSLYNAALYRIRQSFIHQGKYISYNQMDKTMQKHEAYQGLPRKISQQVLRQLAHNWESFFKARDAYKDKQHFVQLPHARFIDMLSYKAKLVGIQVMVQEESYTSKASFLDLDPIPTYGEEENEPAFRGRRVKRGMYKAGNSRKINADVNGSYNIMRKALPNVFGDNGIGDVNKTIMSLVVHPGRIVVPLRTLKSRIV